MQCPINWANLTETCQPMFYTPQIWLIKCNGDVTWKLIVKKLIWWQ